MLVTTVQAEHLICPLRRRADGSEATCIHVACMGWKFGNARGKDGGELGWCGYAGKAHGSWKLEAAKRAAARAPAHVPAPERARAREDHPANLSEAQQVAPDVL